MDRRNFLAALSALLIWPVLPKIKPSVVVKTGQSISPEQINRLVNDTLKDLGKLKFADISAGLQKHVVLKRLLCSRRVEKVFVDATGR